ncbi:alpha/beta hydrolase [Pseudonocardia aurantiaca]|uniref:Alpha/beta fold hydrolase n=1 Tax=Pseudonocardia aurantiaca TaxID=75290 RepID=A0ABW4FCB2_9PSEU
MTPVQADRAGALRKRRRGFRIVLVALGVVPVVLTALIARYVDTNIHYYERDMADLARAGIVPKQAHVDGHVVSYAEGPDNGPAMLLIHGQGSQWQDHAKVLPELVARHHVFAVDVPGHGGSGRLPANQYTNVRIRQLLATFVERVVGSPVLVSGHSSGGLLAVSLAAERSDLVIGVLLEDPPLYSSTPQRLAGTVGGGLPRLAQEFLRDGAATDFTRHYVENGDYFSFFGALAPPIVSYASQYLDSHQGEPLEVFFLPPLVNVFFRGLVHYDPAFGAAFEDGRWYSGFDTDATLAAVTCPVVLLHTNFWSEQYGTYYSDDGVLMAAMDDQDVARALDRLQDAELMEVASGHLVHFERPERYLEAVTRLDARTGS